VCARVCVCVCVCVQGVRTRKCGNDERSVPCWVSTLELEM
jgi:hypothetical protein